MKTLFLALALFSTTSWAETHYMKNDGLTAPETLEHTDELSPGIDNLTPQREEMEDALNPPSNAQEIQREEDTRIEDNYLIGPYNGQGEYTFPNDDEKERREKLKGRKKE